MAILNVGSWETWVREVLFHEPGSNFFLYNDDFGDDIKFKDPQYYLEASPELLDAAEEWYYDMDTRCCISSCQKMQRRLARTPTPPSTS